MKVKDALKKVRAGEILIPISDANFYRSKGKRIFNSGHAGYYTLAGDLYLATSGRSLYDFKDVIQITEWTKEVNDPTPYLNNTVKGIVAGNYGDVFIIYKKEAADVEG